MTNIIENPQYSILVKSTTVNALKDLSLETGHNQEPYNDLIMWLIKFYHENKQLKENYRINLLEVERQQDQLKQQQRQVAALTGKL